MVVNLRRCCTLYGGMLHSSQDPVSKVLAAGHGAAATAFGHVNPGLQFQLAERALPLLLAPQRSPAATETSYSRPR